MEKRGIAPKRGRAAARLLALALAASLLLAAPSAAYAEETGARPAGEGAASALPTTRPELERECSLTMNFPKLQAGDDSWDLKAEDTQADLYLLARAVPVPGYGGYGYALPEAAPWAGEIRAYIEAAGPGWHLETVSSPAALGLGAGGGQGSAAGGGQGPAAPVAAEELWPGQAWAAAGGDWLYFYYNGPADSPENGWAGLLGRVAEAFFGPGAVVTPVADDAAAAAAAAAGSPNPLQPTAGGPVGQRADGLAAGLYLTILHGKDLTGAGEYMLRCPVMGQNGEPEKDEDGNKKLQLCSMAYTAGKSYLFQPQLISLPAAPEVEGEGWAYAAAAVSKCSLAPRYATLQLTKTLNQIAAPALFVFLVRAVDPAGEIVFEQRVSFTFDAAGSQRVTIDGKIPAGSTVTVTEEYTGNNYSLVQGGLGVTVSENPGGGAVQLPQGSVLLDEAARTITINDIPAGNLLITPAAGGAGADGPDGGTTLPAGDTVAAAFANAPDKDNGGGGAVNRFTPNYQDSANRHWEWTQKVLKNDETGGSAGWTVSTPRPVHAPGGNS